MSQTVQEALATTKLYSDGQDYVLVKLPSAAIMAAAGVVAEISEPFCALLVDKDEVSLIILAEAWEDFAPRLRGHTVAKKQYRLITFDAELELSLVGFMAQVSRVLADAQVPILPLAAFTRDHILVPADYFDVAMTALQRLKSGS
jgi:hypothetical protein